MLKLYSAKHISKILSCRAGETKLGEKLKFISDLEELEHTDAHYVVFGIPEDIGVRANHGKAGTSTAWSAFLKAFINVQNNQYNKGENILLLGEVDTEALMHKAGNIDAHDPNYLLKLGDLVETLDVMVSEVVKKILTAGKFPVIIGGGHNNAFGNIKGASKAYGQPINVINIDAHTDLRSVEHRHSGNGFSYAFRERFLSSYSVFGLHKNYTPNYIFETMKASRDIQYKCFEDLPHEDRLSEFRKSIDFIQGDKFGMEVDCDAITNFPSSAISPSGFSTEEVSLFLREAAKEQNCCYLHICEAIASETYPTGKALSFFVTDFIRERNYV